MPRRNPPNTVISQAHRPPFGASMPLLDTVTKNYEAHADSVSVVRKFLPSARTVATGIGLGRVAIGAAFLAAPTVSVRILGVSNATAKRMAFLARMTAA